MKKVKGQVYTALVTCVA